MYELNGIWLWSSWTVILEHNECTSENLAVSAALVWKIDSMSNSDALLDSSDPVIIGIAFVQIVNSLPHCGCVDTECRLQRLQTMNREFTQLTDVLVLQERANEALVLTACKQKVLRV